MVSESSWYRTSTPPCFSVKMGGKKWFCGNKLAIQMLKIVVLIWFDSAMVDGRGLAFSAIFTDTALARLSSLETTRSTVLRQPLRTPGAGDARDSAGLCNRRDSTTGGPRSRNCATYNRPTRRSKHLMPSFRKGRSMNVFKINDQ